MQPLFLHGLAYQISVLPKSVLWCVPVNPGIFNWHALTWEIIRTFKAH